MNSEQGTVTGDKPKIFVWCLATGVGTGAVNGSTPGGDVSGFAMAEDGTGLAAHWSSSVGFSKHDLGLTSDWQHSVYATHYPQGYELEWIDEKDLDGHEAFQAALKINLSSKAVSA